MYPNISFSMTMYDKGPAHGDVPRAPHNQNPALSFLQSYSALLNLDDHEQRAYTSSPYSIPITLALTSFSFFLFLFHFFSF